MVTALFAALAVALLALSRCAPLLVAVVCLGVAYDNAVIAAGAAIGEGDLLRALSAGRFAVHALLTPLLVVVAARLVRRARVAARVLAGLLIAVGVWTEIVRLDLGPRRYAGTLRYVNEAAAGPPIPAVVVIIVLVVAGAILWRRNAWPWLCLGAIAMFAAAAAGASVPWLGNLGELVLLASVTATARLSMYRSTDGPGD